MSSTTLCCLRGNPTVSRSSQYTTIPLPLVILEAILVQSRSCCAINNSANRFPSNYIVSGDILGNLPLGITYKEVAVIVCIYLEVDLFFKCRVRVFNGKIQKGHWWMITQCLFLQISCECAFRCMHYLNPWSLGIFSPDSSMGKCLPPLFRVNPWNALFAK